MEENGVQLDVVNKWYGLLGNLRQSATPHDIYENNDELRLFLFYPSIEEVKCIVSCRRDTDELSIIGENFISDKRCKNLFPMEDDLSYDELSDRIAEDEWENYPTDEFLTRRVKKAFDGVTTVRWNNATKVYDNYEFNNTTTTKNEERI